MTNVTFNRFETNKRTQHSCILNLRFLFPNKLDDFGNWFAYKGKEPRF